MNIRYVGTRHKGIHNDSVTPHSRPSRGRRLILVSLYARTLTGEFFVNPETLNEYRRILSLADGVFEAAPLAPEASPKPAIPTIQVFMPAATPGRLPSPESRCTLQVSSTGTHRSRKTRRPSWTVMDWTEALRFALQIIYQHLSPDPA
jgi:hypothetical protein